MASASDIRAGRAYIELYLKEKVAESIAAIGTKIRGLGAALKGFGAGAFGGSLPEPVAQLLHMAMSPAGAFAGFQAATKIWAHGGEEMLHLAQKTGMSVEQMSELAHAAHTVDVETTSVQSAIGRMQRSLVEAAGGAEAPTEALQRLGLTVGDFKGLDAQGQFLLFAERLSKLEDPALRAAVAFKIFGRGAQEIFPLLEQGRDGIEEMMAESRNLGFVMGKEEAEAAEKLAIKFKLVERSVKYVIRAIGEAVSVMQGQMLDKAMDIVLGVRDWVKANQEAVQTIAKVVAIVVFGGGVLVAFGTALAMVATIFTAVATAAGVVATIIGAVLSPIGLIVAGLVGLGYASVSGMGIFGAMWDYVADRAQAVAQIVQTAMDAVWNAMSGGEIQLAWNVVVTGATYAWRTIAESFMGIWGVIKGQIVESFWSAWDGFKVAASNTLGWFQKKWIGVREGIVDGLLKIVETITATVVDMFAGMGEMLSNMITGLREQLPTRLGGLSAEDAEAAREQAAENRRRTVLVASKGIFADLRASRKAEAKKENEQIDAASKAYAQDVGQAADERVKKANEAAKEDRSPWAKWRDEAWDAFAAAAEAAMAVKPREFKGAKPKQAGVFDPETAGMKWDAQGTFSGAGAVAMGRGFGGGPLRELADTSKGILDNADKILVAIASDGILGVSKKIADNFEKLRIAFN